MPALKTTHRGSLHRRLFWTTVGGMALALALSFLALTTLFRDHVVNQFQNALGRQLDQLLIALEFDANSQPEIEPTVQFDPRLQRQYSGFYWQIDVFPDVGMPVIGRLRSRSLWDTNLTLSSTIPTAPGGLIVSETVGPKAESLLVLQRIVSSPESPGRLYRLTVAGDLRLNLEATERFGYALALVQMLLLLLLILSAWAQVRIALKPLRALQQALKAVRQGEMTQLSGRFPQEIQPLVDDFNQVLSTNMTAVERARTQAGNLAHALKTPLAILENETSQALLQQGNITPESVKDQLTHIRRHIDWHLMRARMAAVHGISSQHTNVVDTLEKLLRVLVRVFAHKSVDVHWHMPAMPLWFAGEEQDLQEILGNLLENAFKWTKTAITITVAPCEHTPDRLLIAIEDDGPGIALSRLETVIQRGVRLDESTPGSGLGLAIVQELVHLYRGEFTLENLPGEHRGLRASVRLPRHLPLEQRRD